MPNQKGKTVPQESGKTLQSIKYIVLVTALIKIGPQCEHVWLTICNI